MEKGTAQRGNIKNIDPHSPLYSVSQLRLPTTPCFQPQNPHLLTPAFPHELAKKLISFKSNQVDLARSSIEQYHWRNESPRPR